MSAVTQASAQVAKTVAVSTGKVTNAKSMMVWKPHGNKYVFAERDVRRRRKERERGVWDYPLKTRADDPLMGGGGRRAIDVVRASPRAREWMNRTKSFLYVYVFFTRAWR